MHPLTKRAYAAPGICWKEDRQEMGCGKRRYFAQVLIARLAAIFDDSICESLIPHFFRGFFDAWHYHEDMSFGAYFWARLEFSSSQQNVVIVWLMLLFSWNKDLCDHMEKMIKLLLVRLNGNSVICWLTINQLKFSESNQALPETTA